MFQTKERDKTPEEQLSEVEIDNQPEKENRAMNLKITQELSKRMDAQSEKLDVLNKEFENIKNNEIIEEYNN